MGTPASAIPASHPDAGSFSSDRPFLDQQFDLVFCDGQVLRTHERPECTSHSYFPKPSPPLYTLQIHP